MSELVSMSPMDMDLSQHLSGIIIEAPKLIFRTLFFLYQGETFYPNCISENLLILKCLSLIVYKIFSMKNENYFVEISIDHSFFHLLLRKENNLPTTFFSLNNYIDEFIFIR